MANAYNLKIWLSPSGNHVLEAPHATHLVASDRMHFWNLGNICSATPFARPRSTKPKRPHFGRTKQNQTPTDYWLNLLISKVLKRQQRSHSIVAGYLGPIKVKKQWPTFVWTCEDNFLNFSSIHKNATSMNYLYIFCSLMRTVQSVSSLVCFFAHESISSTFRADRRNNAITYSSLAKYSKNKKFVCDSA